MRTLALVAAISLLSFTGCGKWGDPVPGVKLSGDLVPVVLQSLIKRGGHPITNDIPSIQARWTLQSNVLEHAFFVRGDHFAEIQSLFTRALGEPDPLKGSIPVARLAGGSTRSGSYHGQQAGALVSFAGDTNQTVITVIGALRP